MTASPARSARSLVHRWVVVLSAVAVAMLGLTVPASAADATGSFGGRVTDVDGSGIEGALVGAYTPDGNTVGLSVYTDADGYYQIDDLPVPDSDYLVWFWAGDGGYIDQYYPGVYAWEDAMGVPIVAGEVTQNVDAVMVLGGYLSGTVTGPTSEPLPGVTVYLYGSTTVQSATTDEFGSYEFGPILPGDYTVWFGGFEIGLASEYYDDTYDEASAAIVTVTPGGTTASIDASLGLLGSIAGVITGPGDVPLVDVTVTAFGMNDENGGATSTAVDGSYSIDGLLPGDYIVEFDGTAQGYVLEYFDDVLDSSSAMPVGVYTGTETGGVDAALAAGGSVAGTVTGPGGAPVENVAVWAYPSGGGSTGLAYTDAAGHYRIDGLLPGDYTIEFSGLEEGLTSEYYDDASSYLDADTVAVTAGVVTPDIDAALESAGAISGTVTGPSGPVGDVYVNVTDSMGIGVGTWTDRDGTYLVEGLRPGAYLVRFEGAGVGLIDEYYDDARLSVDADHVAVAAGQTTAHVDALLARGGAIAGTVTGPDGPAEGVSVNVTGETGWWTAVTDADGAYSVGGLRTGAYEVYFGGDELGLVSEYYDDSLTAEGATPVSVTAPANVTGVDAVLAEGATISGTVAGPEGPVQGVWVGATDEQDGRQAGYAMTDTDGRYTLGGLVAGAYVISFEASEVGLVSEYYDDSLTSDGADPVAVTLGEDVVDVDAVLAAGGSISGTVTGPSGPVQDAYVSAWGRDGVGHGYGYTAADGTYVVEGLAPDDYEVSFEPPDESLRGEFYDDQLSWRGATLVGIAQDQHVTGIDAVLMSSSIPLFSDVPVGHPFDDEIEWLATSGVTTGYPDGTFHPSAPVERQAMAAFLYRFAGEPPFTPPATPTFSDVPRSHPFFTEIEWLADTGITTGWPDHTFRPTASVERQAMAAFLYRYAEEPPFTDPATASFTDVPTSSPFFTEVEWLADTGITTGWPDHTFRPANRVERQAMAAFLMRFDQWLYA